MKRDEWNFQRKRILLAGLFYRRGLVFLGTLLLALLFFILGVASAHGQTVSVKAFPGSSVGEKLTNAQNNGCPTSALTCLLTIEPDLNVFAEGTLPSRCANCLWIDYRSQSLGVRQGIGAGNSLSTFGSGTVNSFSAGTLSPLFTTSVATPTTTPALSFALSNANQNQVFAGPASGGAGAPGYRALVAADLPAGSSSWTFNAGNKRWELFDSTITTWLVGVHPGIYADANFGNCINAATTYCGGGRQWLMGGGGTQTAPTDGYQVTTTAVANNVNDVAPTRQGDYQAANIQSFWVEFDTIQTDANTTQRIGLFTGVPTADPPSDGIYLERLGADTNWFLVTRASSVQTRCDTTVAHSAGVFNFVVVKTGTTSVAVYVPGTATAKCTNSTNIPANATVLYEAFQVKTLAAATKSLKAMRFLLTGLQQGY